MAVQTILVTGAQGFLGRHLVRHLSLAFAGARVVGWDRSPVKGGLDSQSVDLADAKQVSQALRELKPTWVFHLAGRIHAPSFGELYQDNVLATLNLLEGCLVLEPQPRVIIPGSAAEYGSPDLGTAAIQEDQGPAPVSHYGLIKSYQSALAMFYARKGLSVMVGRIFNIIGAGAQESSAIGTFAAQLARIKKWEAPPSLSVGNLESHRDYLDVEDISGALAAIALKGRTGQVYNICSGKTLTMRAIVDQMIAHLGLKVEIVQDPSRFRAGEVSYSCGNPQKLQEETGWSPHVSLGTSVQRIFEAKHHG